MPISWRIRHFFQKIEGRAVLDSSVLQKMSVELRQFSHTPGANLLKSMQQMRTLSINLFRRGADL
ncbi:hypothetical protein, partial [Caballeronia sp.]|uniref:hypothetical protein n=1 Tax=Caballeronia sp. TaxID=1931223 RepID=UPI003C592D24